MGDERTERIHVPDGPSGAFIDMPGDRSCPGVLLLTFRSPVRTLEG